MFLMDKERGQWGSGPKHRPGQTSRHVLFPQNSYIHAAFLPSCSTLGPSLLQDLGEGGSERGGISVAPKCQPPSVELLLTTIKHQACGAETSV